MNDMEDICHFRVKQAYARDDNLLFGERIYRENAKFWLYKALAKIVCKAARTCYETHGLQFVLYDGLRTVEAQEAMMNTRLAKENPHWMIEPRLLSTPGGGGHPRGMAIDIGLEDDNGELLDMGCPFDFLAEASDPEHNPAHREYQHSDEVRRNREILDNAMIGASESLGIPLTPLAQEWWDFRLPLSFYGKYTPLSESDLPEDMKMMSLNLQFLS
jgi:D-alanyl-D-alanine dipeptidase